LQQNLPKNWRTYCDEVTGNFRIIDPKEFRIIGWAGYIEEIWKELQVLSWLAPGRSDLSGRVSRTIWLPVEDREGAVYGV
jgi:hypothetical protein